MAFHLTGDQRIIYDAIFNHIDLLNIPEENCMGIVQSPTGSGKTALTFMKVIPESFGTGFDIAIYATTSVDNINNCIDRYGEFISDIPGVDQYDSISKIDFINDTKRSIRKNRKVILIMTHDMLTDISLDIVKLANEKNVLIIKDEASRGSTSGPGFSYASTGNIGNDYSLGAEVIRKCMKYKNTRWIGLSGTPTEEQIKFFNNQEALKLAYEKHNIPYLGPNTLAQFIELSPTAPLESEINSGSKKTHKMYKVICRIKESRTSKSFIGKKVLYDLRKDNCANPIAFGKQVEQMFISQNNNNEELCKIRHEIKEHVENEKPTHLMSLIFIGHDPEDKDVYGKTLVLWEDGLKQIEKVCKKLGKDRNRILLFTSESIKTLSGKDLSEENFDNLIESGNYDCIVAKNKLVDGYDLPRIKYILTARQLVQTARNKKGHTPSILRAGQMLGRASRINHQIPGVWNREQLRKFLKKFKLEHDVEKYKLILEWIKISNTTEIYVPNCETMNYAVLCECESSGTLEDFSKDIGADEEFQQDRLRFKRVYDQNESNRLKKKRYCEAHGDKCFPLAYSSAIKDFPNMTEDEFRNSDMWFRQLQIDHKDGNRHNNSPENTWTVCANYHSYKTYIAGDEKNSYTSTT